MFCQLKVTHTQIIHRRLWNVVADILLDWYKSHRQFETLAYHWHETLRLAVSRTRACCDELRHSIQLLWLCFEWPIEFLRPFPHTNDNALKMTSNSIYQFSNHYNCELAGTAIWCAATPSEDIPVQSPGPHRGTKCASLSPSLSYDSGSTRRGRCDHWTHKQCLGSIRKSFFTIATSTSRFRETIPKEFEKVILGTNWCKFLINSSHSTVLLQAYSDHWSIKCDMYSNLTCAHLNDLIYRGEHYLSISDQIVAACRRCVGEQGVSALRFIM